MNKYINLFIVIIFLPLNTYSDTITNVCYSYQSFVETNGSNSVDWKLGLAACYDTGFEGFEKNKKKAIKIYSELAETGNSEAQFWMGKKLMSGSGITKNTKKAIQNYILSSEQALNMI